MTTRHSKGARFFCYPQELKAILDVVFAKNGVELCVATKRGDRWFFREASAETSPDRPPVFYVHHPDMTKEDGLDSLANIVQIWLPALMGGDLRMGEVGMLITDSELDGRVRELQGEIYSVLRKELTSRFKRGVWGRNSNTGGEHFYKDILISKAAEDAARAGLILKPQLGDGFVTYSPDRAQ